jgi:2-polyprenyl-6-methoxyphenol hydroxylase-like FAD-dependent oxidoreductase
MSGPRALIVGAGIGGLAAGIALTRAGLEVDVYERADAMHEVGAGISLWANAIHALGTLGLEEAILSASAPGTVAGLRVPDGTIVTTPAMADLEQRVGVVCIVLHRAELQSALLGAFGRERVHLGATCVRVIEDRDGAHAEFADGSVARGDVVVGADGLSSVVRAGLHGAAPPTYAGYTAWRAVVPFDTRRVQGSETWGAGARFGMVPMSGNRVYWFATKNVPEGERQRDEKAGLRDLFRGWHDPVEALIDATDPASILRNDIYDRPVLGRWGRGRVTLLGDAAHPMTPNLGQGACQALEDAVVLARCLQDQPDIAMALRAYETRRISRANALVRRSRQVGRIGQVEWPVAVWLRKAMIGLVSPRLQARQLEAVIGYKV